MHTFEQPNTAECPFPAKWGDELPGRGLPTNDQINADLFGDFRSFELPPAQPEAKPARIRVEVTGVVVLDPGGLFANWAKSRLDYSVFEVDADAPPRKGPSNVHYVVDTAIYRPAEY